MSTRPDHGSGPPKPAARTIDSQLARPVVRVALLVAALSALGAFGHAASAGAFDRGAAPTSPAPPSPGSSVLPETVRPSDPSAVGSAVALPRGDLATRDPAPSPSPRTAATPDSPVVLNTADVDELRRLPGIGEKRANAVVLLRSKLGRFHALEDLLKVKGIGRATLKRLRPLLRVDLPPVDAGSAMPTGPPTQAR